MLAYTVQYSAWEPEWSRKLHLIILQNFQSNNIIMYVGFNFIIW